MIYYSTDARKNEIYLLNTQSVYTMYQKRSWNHLRNINTFCDWLSETIVIRVYDWFFKNYISLVSLSFIVLATNHSACSYRHVATRPHACRTAHVHYTGSSQSIAFSGQ